MDTDELQRKVVELSDARDWAQYHNPKDLAILLSLEAAELLEVFQWGYPQEVAASKNDAEGRGRVKEELGDILIYAHNMCHAFGFDPSEVIMERLDLTGKEYPVEKVKGSAKKYTES